jgi:uncharacterized protein
MSPFELVLVIIAALAAGMVNALAGGGTLITFAALTAIGIPPIAATVTNTVALSLGYIGATFAQVKQLKGQRKRVLLIVPVAIVGSLIGALLLLSTEERLFRAVIPFLILFAAALLAAQDSIRAWLLRRSNRNGSAALSPTWILLPVGLTGIYGGYFGGGLGVILLAVLGLLLEDSLTRLNALKQVLTVSINMTATFFFVFSDKVLWPVAATMAGAALLGGACGGRLAGRVNPSMLRWIVVIIGVIVAIFYFVR